MMMDARTPLLSIARKFNFSLLQLANAIESPEFTERAAALQRLNDTRAALISSDAAPTALSSLTRSARATIRVLAINDPDAVEYRAELMEEGVF